jgi:hypothetical protein
MNVIIGILLVIIVLFLVQPAQAANDLFIDNIIPKVSSSIRVPNIVGSFIGRKEVKITGQDDINGRAVLVEIPENLDTQILVEVSGLKPGEQYVPIYYGNSDCKKEIDSVDKAVKGAFTADQNGQARIEDRVKDSVNRIGSVSLRTTKDFKLAACGKV